MLREAEVPTNGHRRRDVVQLFASREMVREFALFALAVLFHGLPEANLSFVHPASTVSTFRVRVPRWDAQGGMVTGARFPAEYGRPYWAEPTFFSYQVGGGLYVGDPSQRPMVWLTDPSEILGAEPDWWPRRNTAVGFGTDVGLVATCQFFLDMAATTAQDNPSLWDNGPTGELAHTSAELQLVFPEHPWYSQVVDAAPE